jgi:hypothetical protein
MYRLLEGPSIRGVRLVVPHGIIIGEDVLAEYQGVDVSFDLIGINSDGGVGHGTGRRLEEEERRQNR